MNDTLKYVRWCVRYAADLRGLVNGASLRDLVLRRDLLGLGFSVSFAEARGLGEATLKVSLIPRLRDVMGATPPATVLDVGAQYGQFTRAALLAFPGCRVYAFEPLAPSHARLLRAIEGRSDSVAFPFGLGDKDESTVLGVSANPGSSSVLPMDPGHVRAFPGTGQVRQEGIQVRRLDSVLREGLVKLDRPVLMKVDVQGFEDRVFEGCGTALDLVDVLIVEMSLVKLYEGQLLADGVRSLLEARGFRFERDFDRIPSATSGEVVQVDGLFRRN